MGFTSKQCTLLFRYQILTLTPSLTLTLYSGVGARPFAYQDVTQLLDSKDVVWTLERLTLTLTLSQTLTLTLTLIGGRYQEY